MPAGETAAGYLRQETYIGAHRRFPDGIPAKVQQQIEHELALIAELAYEPYFLTVYDIVRFARSQRHPVPGARLGRQFRAVCYCLGITEVDPARGNLLFERFISKERNEPPDIDVDFEHQRREEVIQYIYAQVRPAARGVDRRSSSATGRERAARRRPGAGRGSERGRPGRQVASLVGWQDRPVPSASPNAAWTRSRRSRSNGLPSRKS